MMPSVDLARLVAFRAHGAWRFMDRIDAAMQDIEGAIGQAQYGAAALQARRVALLSLSIRSLAVAGESDLDDDSASFDFFAGVPAGEVAEALALANEAADLEASTADAWLARLKAHLQETERQLGYDAPLPPLRSPSGAFGMIGLLRRWGPLLDELGLPPLLPAEWSQPAGRALDTSPQRDARHEPTGE